MGKFKKRIKRKVFDKCPTRIFVEALNYKTNNYNKVSFSQEGEDMIIDRYMNHKNYGFYIDIGAHHPMLISNTYKFYLRGWRGINIDAMPGSMELFKKLRPDDINLEFAISDVDEKLTFYMFNGPELNTFSESVAKYRDGKNEFKNYHIIGTKEISTHTLAEILDKHMPPNVSIDFFTIDVEGLDFQVLKSNDWNKYRPKLILAEETGFDIVNMEKSPLYTYLTERNYSLVAKTFNTLFFKDNDYIVDFG